jgi:hypothetical protein
MCILEVYTCIFKFSVILNIRIATELHLLECASSYTYATLQMKTDIICKETLRTSAKSFFKIAEMDHKIDSFIFHTLTLACTTC